MSSSSIVTDNVTEHIRDPRVEAWNDVPSSVAGSIAPAVPDPVTLSDELTFARSETVAQPAAASALANVGTVTLEQFIGLAAPMMFVLGLYSSLAGVHEVLANFSKGDIGNAMYRFGLVGASAPSLFQVMLGVSLFTFAQITSRRRWLSFAMMFAFVVVAIVLLAAWPIFVLDAIQARPALPDNLSGNVLIASAAFVSAFLIGSSVTFGACAWTLRKHAAFLATDKKTIAKAWDK